MQPFVARNGIRIAGVIQPPVEDARIQLVQKGTVLEETRSSIEGLFMFGPYFEMDEDVEIHVEKQGFEFAISKKEPFTFSVQSSKLVKVEVRIEMDNADKSGVVVALAGSRQSHRSNAQTNKEGIVAFWKLPIDSYYIKPLLKEYEFEPPFVQLEVDGTQDKTIAFDARRIGFSVYGIVLGLNDQVKQFLKRTFHFWNEGFGRCFDRSAK